MPPMTLEAEVLHFADNASAKTASMADALADPDNFAGEALVSARGALAARSAAGVPRAAAIGERTAGGKKTERPPSRG